MSRPVLRLIACVVAVLVSLLGLTSLASATATTSAPHLTYSYETPLKVERVDEAVSDREPLTASNRVNHQESVDPASHDTAVLAASGDTTCDPPLLVAQTANSMGTSARPAAVAYVRLHARPATGVAAKTKAVGDDLLKPGPWAQGSVPSSAQGTITSGERKLLNPIGNASDCHSWRGA